LPLCLCHHPASGPPAPTPPTNAPCAREHLIPRAGRQASHFLPVCPSAGWGRWNGAPPRLSWSEPGIRGGCPPRTDWAAGSSGPSMLHGVAFRACAVGRSLLLFSHNGRARLAPLAPALAERHSTASRYVCARLLCCRAIRARRCFRVFRRLPLQRNVRARKQSSSRRALLCPTPTHALPTSLRLRLPRRAVRCCCRRREISLGTGPGAQGEALDMPGGEYFVQP